MFESAKLKLKRADHHIADLEREFKAFVSSKPYTCGVHNDSDTGKVFVEIVLNDLFPEAIPVIIGDAINNLRCVLDHVVWALVGWDGGKQDRHTKFPMGQDRASYNGTCNGIKTPSSCVKDLLVFFEAFPEGRGKALYILNELNNADKHRIITPVLRATQHPDLVVIGADGVIKRTLIRNTVISGSKRIRITDVPAGTRVEFPNGTDCSLGIFFREEFEGDVFETLKSLRKAAFHVIEYTENCVTANPKSDDQRE